MTSTLTASRQLGWSEPDERPRPVEGERQGQQRQRRGEARPDGEGERVDLSRPSWRRRCPPPRTGRPARPEGTARRSAPASRPEPMTAIPAKATTAPIDLRPARPLAQDDPGEHDREIDLRLDDQRGEPDRKALADRDEQQRRTARRRSGARRGRPSRPAPWAAATKKHRRNAAKTNRSADKHQRRRLADADLDGDEGQAPDDRDADRGERVARGHAAAGGRASARTGRGIAGTYLACQRPAPVKNRDGDFWL